MATVAPIAFLVVGGLAAVAIAVLQLRAYPTVAFIAWASVLFFVPVWVGATAGIFWSAITGLTILLVIVNWSLVRLSAVDGLVLGFAALTLFLFGMKAVDLGPLLAAMLEWIVPYVWGRIVLGRVSRSSLISVIAAAGVLAGGLAVVEALTAVNIFSSIAGSGVLYDTWSPLQSRGGLLRVEGAFGHSIALGAVLAMSSAFVIAARWSLALKATGLAILVTATVLTVSRTGILTLFFTLALATFFLPGVTRSFKAAMIAAALGSAAVIVPFLETIFGAAGSEADGSADYRTDLFVLVSRVRLFGNAGNWETVVSGDYYLGYFAKSVDNALVLTLLRYGYVPTILLFGAIVCVVVLSLRRETRNPAALAITGQLPSLLVVALITQYGMFVWFCVGLAVAWPQPQNLVERFSRRDQVAGQGRIGFERG